MTSLCLQTIRIMYENIAVSYLWKVTDGKKLAAELHKLKVSCLMN